MTDQSGADQVSAPPQHADWVSIWENGHRSGCAEIMSDWRIAWDDVDVPGFSEVVSRFEAIRALHTRAESVLVGHGPYCVNCGDNWPCATVRVLDGEPADD